ncbi:hypothetical protein PPSIR1_40745 [Plesiocystis pacifica SIR-1]|uniref:Uncharacterized protein n=1 Tax=Plesiocystis pacifica SIR-1 TaxID=391625 RepID=A6FYS9_9BACT|nr:OmpH family outer membrane protein [Plesiocystis pacifica]EDM81351.1 hypothetical protein PPSIR1_40745 [Plesiocystis pacifica SIR-1]
MAKALKVPIHLDALLIEQRSSQGFAPAFRVSDQGKLFQVDSNGLAPGVHLHWALPDALTQAHESIDGSRTEFIGVPDLWLVFRYLPPKANQKRKLVVWAIDSVSGARYLLQGPNTAPRSSTKKSQVVRPNVHAGGKRAPLSADQRTALLALSSDQEQSKVQLSGQQHQLINLANNRNWQISAGHQTVLEQLLENFNPLWSLGTPVGDLQEVLTKRDEVPHRLTAAGFQAADGSFPEPEPHEPAPGPAWAAYYPNARNRFGMHDPLSDLKDGEGPVSYLVVGYYLDAEDDPLNTSSSLKRDQFIRACNWDYPIPKSPRTVPWVFETTPRIRDFDHYTERINRILDEITPDELFEEIFHGTTPGVDPRVTTPETLPGDILDEFPELPTDVVTQPDHGARSRQPDFVRIGAETHELAVGQGRVLTEHILSNHLQSNHLQAGIHDAHLAGKQVRGGPRLLGGKPTMANKAASAQLRGGNQADILRKRQALLRRQQLLRKQQTLRNQQALRNQQLRKQQELAKKQALGEKQALANEQELAKKQELSKQQELRKQQELAKKQGSLNPGGGFPRKGAGTNAAALEHKANRTMASGTRTAALANVIDTKTSILRTTGVDSRELLGQVSELDIQLERAPNVIDILVGSLGARHSAPNRIVCHGAVLGVPVKGSDGGIYTGASKGIWENKSAETVLGTTYAATVADLLGRDQSSSARAVLELLHSGQQHRVGTTSGAERAPQLLHQESFFAEHNPDEAPRTQAVMLVPAVLEDGATASIDDDADLPGKAVTRSAFDNSWAAKIDGGEVDIVEMRPTSDGRVALRWLMTKRTSQVRRTSTLAEVPNWGQRKVRIVQDPKIRWWAPADPVVLIKGPRRNVRHGYDGRFDGDGKLRCRLSSQTVSSSGLSAKLYPPPSPQNEDNSTIQDVEAADLVDLGDFLEDVDDSLRATVRELVLETALLDPTNKQRMARLWTDNTKRWDEAANAFETQCEMWRAIHAPDIDEEAEGSINAELEFGGELPSALALKFSGEFSHNGEEHDVGEDVWSPIMVEYEAHFWPAANLDGVLTTKWELGNVEHQPGLHPVTKERINVFSGAPSSPRVYRGRTFPTPAAIESLADSIKTAAKEASATLQNKAKSIAADLERLDILGFSIPNIDEDGAAEAFHAGKLELRKIRVIDTFGQTRTLTQRSVAKDERTSDTKNASGPNQRLFIRPRIPHLAKLHFRFMDARSEAALRDEREARPWLTPVCGYLLPDHVEHAIEVFDNRGKALGQLRHAEQSLEDANDPAKPKLELRWDPAPGVEARLGAAATAIENPTLRGVVQGILDYNADAIAAKMEAETGEAASRPLPRESALSALIRAIDTVQDTVDSRVGRNEFVSTLVGRPVAVVRAQLRVNVRAREPEHTVHTPRGIEARLGSITQADDGLFGYFSSDPGEDSGAINFHRFFPPDKDVKSNAWQHIDDDLGDLPDDQDRSRPIDHPYVDPDATVDLPLGNTVELALLMDPQAGVHAATGLLPRKRLMLDRTQYEEALGNIAPTFKVGPVLLDPKTKAMPVPGLERFDWVWTRRERPAAGADGWSITEVGTLPDTAVLPTEPLQIHEGWLRLMLDEERPKDDEDAAE